MIPLRHTKSELFEIRKRAQQRLCEMLADISAARGTIGAGLTFVFKKFGPVAVMLIERPEHALGDLVATSEIQPLALQLNVIVAQFVVSCVLGFVAAFLSESETATHLVA